MKEIRRMQVALAVVMLASVVYAPAMMSQQNDAPMDMADMQMVANATLPWADFTSPGFDAGMKIAVLHGDPGKKGDYTLRLQFPDGYKFPVHWHPGGEHLTVLSGTFLLGMGGTADWTTARTYAPGDFIYIPAKHPHFGGAKGLTVIQLHGEGPFQLFLGAPKES
jgi:quercetin dioxygenase-like cupin family protein